jgi:hypothetical protein
MLNAEGEELEEHREKQNDKLSKELGIKYDENMKIIIDKDND